MYFGPSKAVLAVLGNTDVRAGLAQPQYMKFIIVRETVNDASSTKSSEVSS
jgi:hypothetical protein